MEKDQKQLDIADIFRKSWEHYKRNWKVLVVASIIIGLVTFYVNRLGGESFSWYWLLSMMVGVVTQLAVVNAGLGAVRGTLQYEDLWKRLDRLVPLFLVSIVVGLLVAVGFMLLIIPGIMLMVALQLAQYVAVDQKLGVVESLYASADLTRGVRWQLLAILLLTILGNIAGGFAFGIGLLVTVPMTYIVMAQVYQQLTKKDLGNRVRAV